MDRTGTCRINTGDYDTPLSGFSGQFFADSADYHLKDYRHDDSDTISMQEKKGHGM
jgi:hypothetical protein